MSKKKLVWLILLVAALLVAFIFRGPISSLLDGDSGKNAAVGRQSVADIQTLADGLQVPWGLAFLPGGDLLVTERPGNLKRIGQNRQVHTIQGVEHTSEGGLLGIVLDPAFARNGWLYVYLTTNEGGGLRNKVERYTYQRDHLLDKKVILGNIPASANHDGGRLAFGPDGKLYITTGDAGDEQNAQNTSNLAGKILRINADGSIPTDNPFNNAVYSYGHRNPQGLAWDDEGRLWSTEHGPSGLGSGFDELNRIAKGANYGWPVIKGDETRAGMERPIIHSGADDTWAPAGLAYKEGSLYFGGLRGQALYQAKLSGDHVELHAHYAEKYGRLRTTAIDPQGLLYITTSNTDGRGSPHTGDDRLLRLDPGIF